MEVTIRLHPLRNKKKRFLNGKNVPYRAPLQKYRTACQSLMHYGQNTCGEQAGLAEKVPLTF